MPQASRLTGRITSHTLRKTTVTRLFQQRIDDKVIKSITGHRSREGLESYKTIENEVMDSTFQCLRGSTENKNAVLKEEKQPAVFNFNNCNVTINYQK